METQHDVPLERREPGEGSLELFTLRKPIRGVARRQVRCVELCIETRALPPQVSQHVQRDGAQPRTELAARVEARARPQRAQQGLLGHVVALRPAGPPQPVSQGRGFRGDARFELGRLRRHRGARFHMCSPTAGERWRLQENARADR